MIVLIGTNLDSGNIVEVGAFHDMDSARLYAFKSRLTSVLWSVWTPRLGETIKSASITGLTLPP